MNEKCFNILKREITNEFVISFVALVGSAFGDIRRNATKIRKTRKYLVKVTIVIALNSRDDFFHLQK